MSSSGFATGCGVGFGVLRFQRKNTAIPANATAAPTPPYKVVFEAVSYTHLTLPTILLV